jgi:hypothetical protein
MMSVEIVQFSIKSYPNTFDVEMTVVDFFSKVFKEIGDFKFMVPTPFGFKSHRTRSLKKPSKILFLLVIWRQNPPPSAFYKPFIRLFCLISVVSAYLPIFLKSVYKFSLVKVGHFFGGFLKEP